MARFPGRCSVCARPIMPGQARPNRRLGPIHGKPQPEGLVSRGPDWPWAEVAEDVETECVQTSDPRDWHRQAGLLWGVGQPRPRPSKLRQVSRMSGQQFRPFLNEDRVIVSEQARRNGRAHKHRVEAVRTHSGAVLARGYATKHLVVCHRDQCKIRKDIHLSARDV